MALLQARALYDFDAQPNTGELSIREGDTLTVTRQDVGEGWWEGENDRGESGLFPETYVSLIQTSSPESLPPPANPPPPLPPGYTQSADDSWTLDKAWPGLSNNAYPSQQEPADDWDDEWDDDDSQTTEATGQAHHALDDHGAASRQDGKLTMKKKSINRFSAFVKSGGEAYILGQCNENVPDLEKVRVVEHNGCYVWAIAHDSYFCTVTSPKKESKMKGLKTFIVYSISPSYTHATVARRYKHFDWLYERLEEKFSMVPIPPLPDKQITGRYVDSFIEHRRQMLQAWVDRICRHPILSQSSVWQHFINCTDEKQWKAGKRRAERDQLVGAKLFLTVDVPETPLLVHNVETETENFHRFTTRMESAVKESFGTCIEQAKRCHGVHKRNCTKIGKTFRELGSAFDADNNVANERLKTALKHTGDTYESIGSMFAEQPQHDWEPLSDTLNEYRGILMSFPEILNIHKRSMVKRKEIERVGIDGQMDQDEVQAVCRRTDVVSYSTLAEISHFKSEQIEDFNSAMHRFLSQQILFLNKMVKKLEESRDLYNPPPSEE